MAMFAFGQVFDNFEHIKNPQVHEYQLVVDCKLVFPCYVKDVDKAMAMVKASTASHRLWQLSYNYGVVVYMEIKSVGEMDDNLSSEYTQCGEK